MSNNENEYHYSKLSIDKLITNINQDKLNINRILSNNLIENEKISNFRHEYNNNEKIIEDILTENLNPIKKLIDDYHYKVIKFKILITISKPKFTNKYSNGINQKKLNEYLHQLKEYEELYKKYSRSLHEISKNLLNQIYNKFFNDIITINSNNNTYLYKLLSLRSIIIKYKSASPEVLNNLYFKILSIYDKLYSHDIQLYLDELLKLEKEIKLYNHNTKEIQQEIFVKINYLYDELDKRTRTEYESSPKNRLDTILFNLKECIDKIFRKLKNNNDYLILLEQIILLYNDKTKNNIYNYAMHSKNQYFRYIENFIDKLNDMIIKKFQELNEKIAKKSKCSEPEQKFKNIIKKNALKNTKNREYYKTFYTTKKKQINSYFDSAKLTELKENCYELFKLINTYLKELHYLIEFYRKSNTIDQRNNLIKKMRKEIAFPIASIRNNNKFFEEPIYYGKTLGAYKTIKPKPIKSFKTGVSK